MDQFLNFSNETNVVYLVKVIVEWSASFNWTIEIWGKEYCD